MNERGEAWPSEMARKKGELFGESGNPELVDSVRSWAGGLVDWWTGGQDAMRR